MAEIPSDSELGPVESALAKLTPARCLLDRDRLMFQAGAISARADAGRRWMWPSIAAALALLASAETIALAVRPLREVVVQQPANPVDDRAGSRDVEILVRSEAPTPEPASPWLEGESLGLRRQVLRHGLEGLPDLPPILSQSVGQEDSAEPLRRYELNKTLNLGGPS